MTSLSQVPHHLVFDRCYVHAPGEAGDYIRGFVWNSAHTALVDSYVSGFKSTGSDTQTVNGWNGPGPFKLGNNYLEAAGENVMFGGAQVSIPDLVPSDIEIRLNTFQKLLSWRQGDPSFAGTAWVVKNLLELKNAQRVLIEGNVFQDHWAHAQSGFFLMLSPRNETNNYWNVVSDITFRYNWIKRVTAGFAVSGHDTNYPRWVPSARVAIHDNIVDDLGLYVVPGAFNGVVLMVSNGIQVLEFEHNTIFNTYTPLMFAGSPAQGPMTGFMFRDNILHGGGYGIAGDGVGFGLNALNGYAPGWIFQGNLIVGPWPNSVGLKPVQFPGQNVFPTSFEDVGFVNRAGGDYHLSATSRHLHAGTSGRPPGADIAEISRRIAEPPAVISAP